MIYCVSNINILYYFILYHIILHYIILYIIYTKICNVYM